MKRACALFDAYRDKELDENGRMEFESHMAVCESCRTRAVLLDVIVRAVKQEEPQPVDMAARIVDRAFRKTPSLEILVASWFRPRFALAFIGMIVAMVLFVATLPFNQTAVAYSEYLQLMDEAEESNLAAGILQSDDGNDLVVFLQGDTR